MRIKKLQRGDIVARQDNARVVKPTIFEFIKAKPRQAQLIDLGGTPSTDTRTAAERNKDYWQPIKGAALVTTPATVLGGLLGSETVNNATGGFGQWLEGKTGIPSEVGEYLNPGAIYGGSKGLNITKNGLATKFIKGDADLGWNALNKNHWIFNREARTPTNVAMATINRVMPFLSNVEKIPARIAAYKVGRRTKGNASVSLKDIRSNESTYTGSATPEGNNGDRNLLGMYLFKNDPLISRSPWFQRVVQSFKPAKGQGFSHGERYNKLYPGIENRRYQMQSVVKDSRPLRFRDIEEFNEYSNGIGKLQGSLLTLKKGGSLVSDGRRFKFKDSPLVRNSKALNNKRDMRKKFMKSDRSTYSNNRIRKGQEGLQFVSYIPVESPSIDIPRLELSSPNVFSTYNIPITRDEPIVVQSKVEEPIEQPVIKEEQPMKRELFNIKPSKGLDEFNRWYDEVEQEDPEAKNYRQFLTKMAEQESGFNSAIQNKAGAPAYGYFQFMQDGKKYNNISAYAGTDVETFRNNPKLQIKAAIKLAKQFERGFNKQDLELAAQKGYTKFGLLGGAWLAGNGGVRKYLQGLANPSDKHWSKSGSGTDVASRIQMFNF